MSMADVPSALPEASGRSGRDRSEGRCPTIAMMGSVGLALIVSGSGLVGVALPRSIRIPGLIVPLFVAFASLVLLGGRRSKGAGAPSGSGSLSHRLKPMGPITASVLALGIGLGGTGLNWPFLGPIGRSVDSAHHGAMVTWIVDHGRLPERFYPELRQFSEYFFFTHRVIADVARLSGLTAMRAMGICGIALMVLLLVSSGHLASAMSRASGDRGFDAAVALVAVFPAALAAHDYTVEMVLRSYFLAQLCALWLCAVACLCLCSGRLRVFVPLIGAASMACYPLQAPIVPGVLVVAWVVTRQAALLKTLAWTVGIGAAGLAVQLPYLGGALEMSQQEGSVAHLRLDAIGGPIVVLLLVLGLIEAVPIVFTSWRGRSASHLGVLGDVAVPAALVAVGGFALTTAEHLAFVVGGHLGVVSKYSAAKIVFQIVPFGLALVGLGAATVVRRIRSLVTSTRVQGIACTAVLIGLLAATAVLAREATTEVAPPMDADGYQLARSLPRTIKPTDVGVVGPYLNPYFISWTGLQRPVTKQTYDLLTDLNPWRAWPSGPTKERYLLVVGRDYVDAFAGRPGVTVVRRHGDSALLRRSGS